MGRMFTDTILSNKARKALATEGQWGSFICPNIYSINIYGKLVIVRHCTVCLDYKISTTDIVPAPWSLQFIRLEAHLS